jgi:hypothetical protein
VTNAGPDDNSELLSKGKCGGREENTLAADPRRAAPGSVASGY